MARQTQTCEVGRKAKIGTRICRERIHAFLLHNHPLLTNQALKPTLEVLVSFGNGPVACKALPSDMHGAYFNDVCALAMHRCALHTTQAARAD